MLQQKEKGSTRMKKAQEVGKTKKMMKTCRIEKKRNVCLGFPFLFFFSFAKTMFYTPVYKAL